MRLADAHGQRGLRHPCWRGDRWVDFRSLQQRLSIARDGALHAANQRPAVAGRPRFVGVGREATGWSPALRTAARNWNSSPDCILASSSGQTVDVEQARDWLTLPSIERVVAKRIDRQYVDGRRRDCIKVNGIGQWISSSSVSRVKLTATSSCSRFDTLTSSFIT